MRLLVVEDEPDLVSVMQKALAEEGYAVDVATNGEEGLYKATTWDYDLIILDLMLPVLDGWGILQELRQTRKVPVLILSARDTINDRVRGLDLGADDYLIKPFHISELKARIRALIRRAHGETSNVLDVGEVQIDLGNRTVRKGGALVPLTPREYALVEMLALNRGKLITRAALYDHLFGEDDDSLSNLMDVHVSNVRKKLGKDFIITRRGEGYLIDV